MAHFKGREENAQFQLFWIKEPPGTGVNRSLQGLSGRNIPISPPVRIPPRGGESTSVNSFKKINLSFFFEHPSMRNAAAAQRACRTPPLSALVIKDIQGI